jgi:hypothetical protein
LEPTRGPPTESGCGHHLEYAESGATPITEHFNVVVNFSFSTSYFKRSKKRWELAKHKTFKILKQTLTSLVLRFSTSNHIAAFKEKRHANHSSSITSPTHTTLA